MIFYSVKPELVCVRVAPVRRLLRRCCICRMRPSPGLIHRWSWPAYAGVRGLSRLRSKCDDYLARRAAQDAPISGQFIRQCKLRMMAREAALGTIANSKAHRLLARNKSFNRTDGKAGGSVTC